MSLFSPLLARSAAALAPLRARALWAHAARTTLAALCALYLAFLFQLDTPYSAMTTVLIVSNPVQGQILAKSAWRLAGTLIGGVVGVALIGFFAQTPTLFLLAFAGWLAIATAASTLLRGFRSYGAVLSGYTVALIAMPAAERPEAIFTLAMARVAVVTLGICCSAAVGALLTGHGASRGLDKMLRQLLAELFSHCRAALVPGAVLRSQRRVLAQKIAGLEQAVRFAAAEDPRRAARLAAQRDAAAAFYGALTAAPALSESLDKLAAPEPRLDEVLALSDRGIDGALNALAAEDDQKLAAAAEQLKIQRQRCESIFAPGGPHMADAAVVAVDRLADLLAELERAARGLTGKTTGEAPLRNATHLDWPWAVRNAFRAGAAILLAGALWIGLGWSFYGSTMVAGAAPLVALLAMRERPSADALNIVWGVGLGALLGLFYLLWVLPQITGFPLLALWLAPPLAIAVALMATPALVFVGTGFGVFFITLLAPSNPMAFDPEMFLNNALATMLGAALVSFVFAAVLPVDAQALRRHVLTMIQNELADVLMRRKIMSAPEWEARMHDRLRLLMARLRAANISADSSLRSGFAALRLGRDILRLRALVAHDAEAERIARAALPSLGRADRSATLKATAQALRARAEQLAPDQAASVLRAAAILPAIDALVAGRRRFFEQALQ